MIVADTNVVSEIMKPNCHSNVIKWFDEQSYGSIVICAASLGELYFGIEKLPQSKKRNQLEESLEIALNNVFNSEILIFDALAAKIYGRIAAHKRSIGSPISTMDAIIAAICIANSATLATRNTKDFEGLDVKLINPFEAA